MIKIEDLASLAKLKLNKEELAIFSQQMPEIIKFVDQLLEIEVSNDYQASSYNQNIWRNDEVSSWDKDERQTALEQGLLESGFVVSPKIR